MLEQLTRLASVNTLTTERRAAIVRALCEGNSVRATGRLTGAAKATVLKLLVDVGEFCSVYQDHALHRLSTQRVEADEIWAFVGAKQRNAKTPSQGDIWTFTALDADSKLMVSWLVGERTPENAYTFMQDVAGRLANRVQLTTDGHQMYLTAVEGAFGYHGVDYAMIVKTYGQAAEPGPQRRYSPMVCTGATKERKLGRPRRRLRVHVLRRARESHHAHANASVHAAYQRVQQEGREPRARSLALLHVLQLLPPPHDADQGRQGHQDDARDGGRRRGSGLDGRRHARPDGPGSAVTLRLTHYRLSTLSVWWVRLGILPDLIEPSSPQQNGQHERMHRTLKAEATRPAAATMAAQQRVFDRFRREYNEERPHEALGQATPASRYAPSPRPYPARLPPLEYPAHWEVRRVSRNGGIRWYDACVNVSHVLGEEYVGFEEIDAGVWNVAFGPLVLGRFDERTLKITDANGYKSRNPRQV